MLSTSRTIYDAGGCLLERWTLDKCSLTGGWALGNVSTDVCASTGGALRRDALERVRDGGKV